MEFNNGTSILSNNSSSQINNEIGNVSEHSEVTSFSIQRNRCYSSSENVVTSRTGDFYRNINLDEQESFVQCTKLFLGGEWIEIPNGLIDDESTFRFVLNKESFQLLSQAAQSHLKRYLPESDITSLDDLLSYTFSNDKNFFFGNPIEKFLKKICDGYFSSVDHVQLRDHKRVLYDHYIRHHQMNLLKKLLISRHTLLETTSKQKGHIGENSTDSFPLTPSIKHLFGELKPQLTNKLITNNLNYSTRRLAKHSNVRRRAKIRARLMIDDCRVKSGQNPGPSSDESAQEEECSVQPLPQNARSTMYTEKFSADLDLYQPIKMRDVADLYREYCYLREVEPDCPSLDITDITLEEVYERTGISFQTERNFFKITEQNFAQIANKQKYPQKQQTQEQQHFCNGGSISQNEIKREVASPTINAFSVELNN